MNFTLWKISCVVYGISFAVIALLSASGVIGVVGIKSTVDWVLVAWLTSYASIAILLVGGTVHSAFNALRSITNIESYSPLIRGQCLFWSLRLRDNSQHAVPLVYPPSSQCV